MRHPRTCLSPLLIVCLGWLVLPGLPPSSHAADVVVHPQPYAGPLRNPLMGFLGTRNGQHEYAALTREYVAWNKIENAADEGADKLREYADKNWSGLPALNMKVIPRVFLEWPKPGTNAESYWPIDSYWPADLPRDFASEQFKDRVRRMVAKMGEAWDNDSRVAFIEMGIVGPWGEQHHPSLTAEMQKELGDAFKTAFTNKLVMNRYPWDFKDYQFGIHWDSFGNPGWEMSQHVPLFENALAERWKTAPMGGEMSFAPTSAPRLGRTPNEAVAQHADTLIRYVRRWHWSLLGWVSDYDPKIPEVATNAARLQSAFGYRFVLDEVRYPERVLAGGNFPVSFTVRNLGSAPFYYRWPVEVSLLDPQTHAPVWKANFTAVDIRHWLPGNFSDIGKGQPTGDKANAGFAWDTGLEYDLPPVANKIKSDFKLPKDLPKGEYLVALAILDPAGQMPSVKFATENYFTGGRHPMGRLGVDQKPQTTTLDGVTFDALNADKTLHYLGERNVEMK